MDSVSKSRKKRAWLITDVYEWAESIITAVIAIVFIFTFIVRVTSVDGESMLPTLHNNDRMLVTNLFYTPSRNDIVVLYAAGLYNSENGEFGKTIIKRVIGLPGDVIELDAENGGVSVNGARLEVTDEGGLLREDGHLINDLTYDRYDIHSAVTVPDGCLFVMGDNRGNSMDSRWHSVGMVNLNYVVGRAFFKVTPFSDFGFAN